MAWIIKWNEKDSDAQLWRHYELKNTLKEKKWD